MKKLNALFLIVSFLCSVLAGFGAANEYSFTKTPSTGTLNVQVKATPAAGTVLTFQGSERLPTPETYDALRALMVVPKWVSLDPGASTLFAYWNDSNNRMEWLNAADFKAAIGAATVADTVYGDVTVSGTGSVWTVVSASTSTPGKVQLATDNEAAASKAVQGNDSRLAAVANKADAAIDTTSVTDNYTLALTDKNKIVLLTAATAKAITIPLHSVVPFPIGAKVQPKQGGAGAVSVAATGGVTINQMSGTLVIGASSHSAYLFQTANDIWELRVDPLNGSGASDPGATEDAADGFQVGSRYQNTTSGVWWKCLVNTASAAKWDQDSHLNLFAADAGANDTYTATLVPAPTAYVTGARYRFKANTANTGAATINFNSIGAKTIVKVAGGITTALADNDIRSGQWVDLVYDGTNMQMQSLLGNAPAFTALPSAAGSSTLASAGEIKLNTTNKIIGVHNGTREVALPLVGHFEISFDPKAVCDGAVDRLFLFKVGNWAPFGITITGWSLSFEADPTTEVDLDLKRATAVIGVGSAALMDALDTTAGVSSETTAANINGGSVVANGQVVYLEFGTAYTETGHQIILSIEYEIEED